MSHTDQINQAMKLLEEANAVIEEGTLIAARLCSLIAPHSEDPEAFHPSLLGLNCAVSLRSGLMWGIERYPSDLRILNKEFPAGIARARADLEKLQRMVTALEAIQ